MRIKNYTIFSFIAIISTSFTPKLGDNYTNELQITAEFNSAVKVGQAEFETLTAQYNQMNSNKTLGGNIDKTMLNKLISGIPSGESYVKLKFCTDTTFKNTSLILVGGKRWYEGINQIEYYRNGGSSAAFCPFQCSRNDTLKNTTIKIAHSEYEKLSSAFAQTGATTLGGRIDKAALLSIIQSLPAESNNVQFMFCTDPIQQKTSIIFIGGTNGQPENSTLYLRNGKTADAFCPYRCD